MGRIQLIGDLIENDTEEQYIQLSKNHILRQATHSELNLITNDLKSSFGNDIFQQDFNPYKQIISQISTGKRKGYSHKEIIDIYPKHFCWVIEKKGDTRGLDLDYLLLSNLDLTIIASYQYHEIGGEIMEMEITKTYPKSSINSILFNSLKDNNYPTKKLTSENIQNIKYTIETVKNFRKEYEGNYEVVHKAFRDFLQLNRIPHDSPFKVLGYFAIIEYLITSKESTSITYQLKTKLSLLNDRMKDKIDLNKYFKNPPKLATLIAKLYDLRSEIAHGSFSGFTKFHINTIEKPEISIPNFIYTEILKKLLLHAMKEPQLIENLKKC